jgi:hypothetical protein
MELVIYSVSVIALGHLETRIEPIQQKQLNSVIKKLNRNRVVARRYNVQFALCAEHYAPWDSVLLLRFLLVVPTGQDAVNLLSAALCIDGEEWTVTLNGLPCSC